MCYGKTECAWQEGKREKHRMKEKISCIREEIKQADAIVIGAGAGLSTAAGFIYNPLRSRLLIVVCSVNHFIALPRI